VAGLKQCSTPMRALIGALVAMLLAIRLMSPAGFMPSFEHGSVTIVACPDAGPAVAPMSQRHHGRQDQHQPCPYAAASALGTAADPMPWAIAVVLLAAALVFARPYRLPDRRRDYEHPPSRGPPVPA